MSDIITEALLEMHYHRALVSLFEEVFGARMLKLLKPSTQQEAWVGFDQGWSATSLSTADLFVRLRQSTQNSQTKVSDFFLGYFLQFKVVQEMVRSSKNRPPTYSTPYYRTALSLSPNRKTGLSQHETLMRLKQIQNANVFYACPMMFSLDQIYDEPDINDLRWVDVSTSPSGWATNQTHFITFQTTTDPSPFWCTEPVEGRAYSAEEWAHSDGQLGPSHLTGPDLIRLIRETVDLLRESQTEDDYPALQLIPRQREEEISRLVPPSFTILHMQKDTEPEHVGGANSGSVAASPE